MSKTIKPLPKKWFAILYTTVFLLCQASFFLTTIGNMPVFVDTIDLTGHESFAIFFNTYYIYFCICAGTIELLMCLFTSYIFADRKWPTFLTFVMMCANMLICNATAVGLYLLDLRNVYFTFQATFAIPIISIFLSSVFMIDDTVDLINGKFELHTSQITERVQDAMKERANETLGGTVFDLRETAFIKHIDQRNEEMMQAEYEASREAALNTIPALSKAEKEEESKEDN